MTVPQKEENTRKRINYEDMRWVDLKEMCKKRRLSGFKMVKAEMIAHLREASDVPKQLQVADIVVSWVMKSSSIRLKDKMELALVNQYINEAEAAWVAIEQEFPGKRTDEKLKFIKMTPFKYLHLRKQEMKIRESLVKQSWLFKKIPQVFHVDPRVFQGNDAVWIDQGSQLWIGAVPDELEILQRILFQCLYRSINSCGDLQLAIEGMPTVVSLDIRSNVENDDLSFEDLGVVGLKTQGKTPLKHLLFSTVNGQLFGIVTPDEDAHGSSIEEKYNFDLLPKQWRIFMQDHYPRDLIHLVWSDSPQNYPHCMSKSIKDPKLREVAKRFLLNHAEMLVSTSQTSVTESCAHQFHPASNIPPELPRAEHVTFEATKYPHLLLPPSYRIDQVIINPELDELLAIVSTWDNNHEFYVLRETGNVIGEVGETFGDGIHKIWQRILKCNAQGHPVVVGESLRIAR